MASLPPPKPRHARFVWPILASTLLAACGDDTVPSAATDATIVETPDTSPTTTSTSTTSTTSTSTLPVDTTTTTTTTTTVATTEDTMEPTSNPTVPEGALDSDVVRTAIADLRERLDDAEAEITVVTVEEVDWPDGSIGCPQPGMVYTQAIVNGTRIVLRHDGVDYEYHQGGRRSVFYCSPSSLPDK